MEPDLVYGDNGDWVRHLQESLAWVGFDPGAIDGDFGDHTSAAVIAFQQAHGLCADGVVGPITWAALNADSAVPVEPGPVADWTDPAASTAVTGSEMWTGWSEPAGSGQPGVAFPVLVRGHRGEWVSFLQQHLYVAGFDPGVVDGDFGGHTETAVLAFQAAAGLPATGLVEESTWAALVPGPAGFDDGSGCQYEPGEKDASTGDPGQAEVSVGVVPTELDEANEVARALLAFDLGVPVEQLDARIDEMRRMGLPVPDPPPPFTPALSGSFALSGFTVAQADLKATHLALLATLVDKLRLNTAIPRYTVQRIEGFTDCAGGFSMNLGIRMARAQATRAGLIAAGALEDHVGPAVASTEAARADQSGPDGRAANRAAVGVLDLVAAPRPTPQPDIPDQTQPTCQEPSDEWSFSTVLMGGAGAFGFGGQGLVMAFHNHRTGCSHWGLFVAGGFAVPGAGISLSFPGSSSIGTLVNEAFSFELSGHGELSFEDAGFGLGRMEGKLTMSSGAMAGQVLDVGGFQFQTPGVDLAVLAGHLEVRMDGIPTP